MTTESNPQMWRQLRRRGMVSPKRDCRSTQTDRHNRCPMRWRLRIYMAAIPLRAQRRRLLPMLLQSLLPLPLPTDQL